MNPLAAALPGKATFCWIGLPAGVPADGLVGREIRLERLGPTVLATFVDPGAAVREHPAVGRSRHDDEVLRALVTEGSRVVAFACNTDVSGRSGHGLQLQVYELSGQYDWGDLTIGADDAVLTAVKRIAGAEELRSRRDAPDWLERRLLFPGPPADGGDGSRGAAPRASRPRRMIAIVRPGQDVSQPTACQVIGQGIVAALGPASGEWRLSRVHQETRSARAGQQVALINVRAEVLDVSVRTGLKRQMQAELARLGSDAGEQTFLATWRRYQDLENRYALRRLADLDFQEYSSWSYLDDSEEVIRFEIVGGRDALLTRLAQEIAADDEIELECTTTLPEAFGGPARIDPDTGLLDLDLAKGNEVGLVTQASGDLRIIDMRMIGHGRDADDPVAPPRCGFLHAAIKGDRRRLERRHRALSRLLDGRIPLPQMLPLLQGIPTRGREQRAVAALSAAAGLCFGARGPNEEQRLALDAALNTPDIAVIQGPPGTGKTELITALQVRLAEEGRSHALLSRSMLLTSYQHAAVDNMVERSKVWNLPSVKIDSRNRGTTAHIENWRLATAKALQEELDTPDGRRTAAMRAVARQAAEYCLAPVSAPVLGPLLAGVADRVAGLVADELLGRLREVVAELNAATRAALFQADLRRESTLRAVRGIRCRPESFADDGPAMAAYALEYLAPTPVSDGAHLDLLGRAADWTGPEGPPFLRDLAAARDELLDWLMDQDGQLFRPAARPDVVDLLNDVVADLDAGRRATDEGVHSALLEFLDELEGDPEAVQATLLLYTTSLAATCQQADSRGIQNAKDGERLFETVIIDEAARANPLDLLIPLTLATRRVILVGDQNQLPHMLEPDVERELRSDAGGDLATLRESLFGRLFTLLHNDPAPGRRRAVRLRKQYRMHPVLGEFVGRSFYQGELSSPRGAEEFSHGLDGYRDRPAAWLRVPHEAGREHGGQSKSRLAEADAICRELRRHIRARPDLTFGVISFYSAQVRLIWERLVAEGLAEQAGSEYRPTEDLRRDADGTERTRLHIGTVDAFQGKQFDVALLSVTRSTPPPQLDPAQADPSQPGHDRYEEWARGAYGHLMLANRLCVAMSRQKRLLVVVGDDAMFTSPLTPPGVAPLREFRSLCGPSSPAGVLLADRRPTS
jgi:AAA domain